MSPETLTETLLTAPASVPLCLLTLSLPQALEETLLDALQALPEHPGPYTVLQGHSLGAGVVLPSAMEQVKGRARRTLVLTVLAESTVPALIQSLQVSVPHPDISWWTGPLLQHGRLA
jgi:hypothetical protein